MHVPWGEGLLLASGIIYLLIYLQKEMRSQ